MLCCSTQQQGGGAALQQVHAPRRGSSSWQVPDLPERAPVAATQTRDSTVGSPCRCAPPRNNKEAKGRSQKTCAPSTAIICHCYLFLHSAVSKCNQALFPEECGPKKPVQPNTRETTKRSSALMPFCHSLALAVPPRSCARHPRPRTPWLSSAACRTLCLAARLASLSHKSEPPEGALCQHLALPSAERQAADELVSRSSA